MTKKHPKTITVSKRAKERIKKGVSQKRIKNPAKGGAGTANDPFTISTLRKKLFVAVNDAVKTDLPVYAVTRDGFDVVVVSKAAYFTKG